MPTYTIDPVHSAADFKIRHLMISNVRGEFSGISGSLTLDPENPADSKVEARIPTATIQTREAQRDAHLKSADFLDVEKYPEITFVSTKFAKNGDGEYKVVGDLTIHGVTKPVTLEVEGLSSEVKDPWGSLRTGAEATTKISRTDFGLTWNAALEAGGFMVGDEVTIHLDLEFTRQ